MSTSLLDLKEQLVKNVRNQRTPIVFTDDDYLNFCISGCQRLFSDTGRAVSWDSEYVDGATPTVNTTLDILQTNYVITASEIEFFQCVRNYWNTLVSYTTNALSVAYAYKPFEFLTQIIQDRENQLTDLFHKMTEYSNMTEINSITKTGLSFDYSG